MPERAPAPGFAASDPLEFLDEPAGPCAPPPGPGWKLLIVDDEEEVHTLTRMVLRNYEFEGRGLHLLSAYSGAASRQVLREHPDLAVIMLDVVMEREDSGLRLVRHIRDELKNSQVRIILRTGQPGQAPEQEVVAQYDINDYKAKTELTAQKLHTTLTGALRSWRDIQALESSRRGLQRVIAASGSLFEGRTRREFAAAVLDQLLELAACPGRQADPAVGALAAFRRDDALLITAARGRFAGSEGRRVGEVVDGELGPSAACAERRGTSHFLPQGLVFVIRGDGAEELLFLLQGARQPSALDCDLIRLYLGNVALAFHNLNLSREIIQTQKEIIHTLGEVVETRSRETANHVLRVGLMADLMARRLGLGEEAAAVLRLAAPMHDVGKVGIPDAILHKAGPLTEGEYRCMQTHAAIGGEILGKSERRIMQAAAQVALQHHERWDGGGYPRGLAGEEIHVFSRITALVDVFDAVASRRIYREAWDMEQVLGLIRAERGRHFDPRLVDCFLEHFDEFVAVLGDHPDAAPAAGEPAARLEHGVA